MTTFHNSASIIKNYKYSENAFLPKIVTIPLVQEKNCLCIPCVQPGDEVKEGDILAKPEKSGCYSPIHSPVPGQVIDIIKTLCPNGKQELSVRIKTKGSFSYLGKNIKKNDWNSYSSDKIKKIIKEKGIINTFNIQNISSLAFQIDFSSKKDGKNLVIRLFDEDPYRITDSLISKLYLDEVIEGTRITAKSLEANLIFFLVSETDTELLERIKKIELKSNEKIVIVNSRKYPSGYEDEIIRKVSRTFKKNENIRLTKKDLFIDAITAKDVYEAVCFGTPVISRYIHFSGNCISTKCILNVRQGTLLSDVVKQIGDFESTPAMVVINGNMCGYSVSDINIPVTKYVKSVSFLSANKKPDQLMYHCISCGNCRHICPRKLSPDLLYLYVTEHQHLSEKYLESANLCAECGLCNSVCPSRLPLSQIIATISESNIKTEK